MILIIRYICMDYDLQQNFCVCIQLWKIVSISFLTISSSVCYSFFWFSEYLNLTVFSVACLLFQIFCLLSFILGNFFRSIFYLAILFSFSKSPFQYLFSCRYLSPSRYCPVPLSPCPYLFPLVCTLMFCLQSLL